MPGAKEAILALKDLIATPADKLQAREAKIDQLRELLRDVYDVAANGTRISDGLLTRIRHEMAGAHRE